ncbi:hypothetical protein BJX99DRAFT_265330 [Aspergillus californicus]
MSQAYPRPSPASSQYATPSPTPRRRSPSRDRVLSSFIELLDSHAAEVDLRAEERLAAYRSNYEMVKNERDSALSRLREQRIQADISAENLEAQMRERDILAEAVAGLEGSLKEEEYRTIQLRNQLDERNNQLSDAEARYSRMEEVLLRSIERTENDNNELREQLVETRLQIDTANSLVTEERSKSNDFRTELATARNQLEDAQRQRIYVESQLANRTTELQRELAQARIEAGLLDTMCSAREELEARCQTLTDQVSNLSNIRCVHESRIHELEEQQDRMNREIRRLNSELRNKQTQNADQLQELRGLNLQLNHLETKNNDITNTNTTLRRKWISHKAYGDDDSDDDCDEFGIEVGVQPGVESDEPDGEFDDSWTFVRDTFRGDFYFNTELCHRALISLGYAAQCMPRLKSLNCSSPVPGYQMFRLDEYKYFADANLLCKMQPYEPDERVAKAWGFNLDEVHFNPSIERAIVNANVPRRMPPP